MADERETAANRLVTAERSLREHLEMVRRAEGDLSRARVAAQTARDAYDAAYLAMAEQYQKTATSATNAGFKATKPTPTPVAEPEPAE